MNLPERIAELEAEKGELRATIEALRVNVIGRAYLMGDTTGIARAEAEIAELERRLHRADAAEREGRRLQTEARRADARANLGAVEAAQRAAVDRAAAFRLEIEETIAHLAALMLVWRVDVAPAESKAASRLIDTLFQAGDQIDQVRGDIQVVGGDRYERVINFFGSRKLNSDTIAHMVNWTAFTGGEIPGPAWVTETVYGIDAPDFGPRVIADAERIQRARPGDSLASSR